jgi:DNA-binding winged helix-turn-helix (wHTH) protein/TolB-like protein/Tfp pilus assembly protein PilF
MRESLHHLWTEAFPTIEFRWHPTKYKPMSTANQFRHTWKESEGHPSYEFGPFVLNTIQHTLLRDGKPVALTPKTYDALLVLVQNSGRMLSKEELMKALWPDSFVEESNLTQQVSMIRRALGDPASDPRYIVTVPGRGYRFVPEVVRSEVKGRSGLSPLAPQICGDIRDRGGESHTPGARTHAVAGKTSEPNTRHPRTQSKSRRWALSSIGALMLLLIAVIAITRSSRLSRREPAQPVIPRSLAILPLQNLRQDPNNDFLGFSLADAVITKLDYVSSLTVRPSTAVEKYRNQVIDIQKVGAELNIDTLLTGSFLRDGDDLRITYQLIDVKTEKILGRGTIDAKYDKLLRVQDNVAEQIVAKLELNLSASEAERIKSGAPIDPLAYEYYLRGVDLHGQHKFPLAIKMLEKSTEIDPGYAPAWAYLGASYTSDAAFEFGGREQYRRAQAAYERALAIQPSQLDAQIFLANLLVDTGKVEQAVPLLRDALKTNPNYAAAHWELGYAYRFAGMLTESVAECERARKLDPLVKANGSVLNAYLYLGQYGQFLRSLPEVNDSSFLLFYRGFGEFYQNDMERASKDFDRAYEAEPSLYAQVGKAFGDSIAHKKADGLEILRDLEEKIKEREVGDPEAVYKIAQAYAILEDKVAALRMVRRSIESGFFCYPYVAADPLLNALHSEPQFGNILEVARQRHEAFKSKFF